MIEATLSDDAVSVPGDLYLTGDALVLRSRRYDPVAALALLDQLQGMRGRLEEMAKPSMSQRLRAVADFLDQARPDTLSSLSFYPHDVELCTAIFADYEGAASLREDAAAAGVKISVYPAQVAAPSNADGAAGAA